MKGADEYYNLVSKAYRLGVGELQIVRSCRDDYKYKNIVFRLSTHARGKCFNIWLFKNEDIEDFYSDDHLEVYGIICGQPGWTEEYGWLVKGSWIKYIKNYFEELRKQIAEKEYAYEIAATERAIEIEKQREKNIAEYNLLFE